jgi:hypothetical protein
MGNSQGPQMLPYPHEPQPMLYANNYAQLPPAPMPTNNTIFNNPVAYLQRPRYGTSYEAPRMGSGEQARTNRSTHLGPSPIPAPPPVATPYVYGQQNQISSDSLVSRANEIIIYFTTTNLSQLNSQGFPDRVKDLFNEARSEMASYPTGDHSNLRRVFGILMGYMRVNGLFSWDVYQGYQDVIG